MTRHIAIIALALIACAPSGTVEIDDSPEAYEVGTNALDAVVNRTACPEAREVEPCPNADGQENPAGCIETDGEAWDYAQLAYLDQTEADAPLRLQLAGESLGELYATAPDEDRWNAVIDSYEVYAAELRGCL